MALPIDHTLAVSRDERIRAGKELRDTVSRKSHALWRRADDERDPVAILEASNAGRVKELLPIRYGRMLQSPFTFYRGAAALMATDLAKTPATGLRVQACGDCHLMSFGLFATAERNLIFDLIDLDETLTAPWEWDLKRLVVSAVIAGRANGHSDNEATAAVMACSESYRVHLAEYAKLTPLQLWYERVDWQTMIDQTTDAESRRALTRFGDKARRRVAENNLAKIAEKKGDTYRFVEHGALLFHPKEEKLRQQMRDALTAYEKTLSEEQRTLYGRYRLHDLAMKVVGIGSVGARCFVALFVDDDAHPLVLQLKEARASALEAHAGKSLYSNHGQRVIMGQRMMQSSSDVFRGWAKSSHGYDFYVRQLVDMKMSAPLEKVNAPLLERYLRNCGWALACAHARSGDAARISGYLGRSDSFDRALAEFAHAYADQNERDYQRLVFAATTKRIDAQSE